MIHFHLQRPFKMRHAFLAIIAVLGLTKRDLEKSGLMARASGCWNDKQIIRDQDYLSDLLTDSQKSNPPTDNQN